MHTRTLMQLANAVCLWIKLGWLVRWLVMSVALSAVPALGGPIEASYRVSLPNGDAGSGTGISDRVVVTNAHVVSNRTQPVVRLRNHGGTLEGQCVYANPACDLAFIYVPQGGIEWVEIGSDPQPGEAIALYGYGGDGVLRRKSGTIRSGRAYMDTTYTVPVIESTAHSVPGDSGGGIFAGEKLVAVNWGNASGAHAVGASNIIRTATVYEQQYCQGGNCYILPPRGRPIFSRPTLPPLRPVQQPQQPAKPATDCCRDILKQIDEIKALIAKVEAQRGEQYTPKPEPEAPVVIDYDKLADKLAERIKPAKGDRGEPGPPGAKGDPATVDLDALAEAVRAKLGPFYIGAKDEAGNITMPLQPVHLGDGVYVKVQLPKLEGQK